MTTSLSRFFAAMGLVALACSFAFAAELPASVGRFEVFEASLKATGNYANPYVDIAATVTITPPDGGAARSIPLFWDGANQWKLRFSPNTVGPWKWSVTSRDAGLGGKSGTFEVVESNRSGSIRPRKDFPLHFERQDGQPFWFLGDTAWALSYDNAEEKYDRAAALAYIDARATQGFNVLHSSLLSELGWGNSGGMPFDDISGEKINPVYWQEVDVRLEHANKQGIVCGLALAWGDKKKTEPFAWRRFPSVEARQRYARYIAARYSAYDTYFLVAGEWHAEVRTRPSEEATIKQEFLEIGDALHAADPHNRMIGIHPMTSHGSVREFVGAAKWMTFGDYQQNYKDLHARILESRKTNEPVVNSEYGYHLRDQSGDGVPDKDNSTSLEAIRHATWDICMAGGYVVTGFGTTYLGGGRDPGPFDLTAARNKPWEEQIGHIKSIFGQTRWWKLEPHDELLSCETARGKDTRELNHTAPPSETYWCLAESGQQYLVYCRGLKSPLTVNIDAQPGQLTATQINPRTGERRVLGGASGRFEIKPSDDKDWVVHISRPGGAPAQKASTGSAIHQWSPREITLSASRDYANPYTDVELTAKFTGPGRSIALRGFWDGGRTFKIRFTPPTKGNWTYVTTSQPADSGLATTGQFEAVAPPENAHGFLRRDERFPTCFVFDDGTHHFMWGTTYYQLLANARRGDRWQEAIDGAQRYGMTKARISLSPSSGGDKSGGYSSHPFLDDEQSQLDLAHWRAADRAIAYMNDHGFGADLILFWRKTETSPQIRTQDERYVRYALARYAAYPNVTWCVVNEWNYSTIPQEEWNHLGRLVRQEDPWSREGNLLRVHSIHQQTRPDWNFTDQSWPSHAILQLGVRNRGPSTRIGDEWAAAGKSGERFRFGDQWGNHSIVRNWTGRYPIVNDEYGYVGEPQDDSEPKTSGQFARMTREKHRQAMWGIATGGGYGSAGDKNDYGSDGRPYFSANWHDTPEYGDVRRLTDFFTKRGIEYWRMAPHNESVVAGQRTYVLAEPGRSYVIYAAAGGDFSLDIPAGRFSVRRYDPRGGEEIDLPAVDGPAKLPFSFPDRQDWVLHLVNLEKRG